MYLGLMSGTSMDGIDAAIVSLANGSCRMVAARHHPYSHSLNSRIKATVLAPANANLDELGRMDRDIGFAFADAALQLMSETGLSASDICAIGSHGQTIRHQPDSDPPFTLQLGDAATIAARTNIVTVADFRRADIALGGQGAPLAPAFHRFLAGRRRKVFVNIGGIANLTVVDGDAGNTIGFDTGPGNTLMDAWVQRHRGLAYDDAGNWAKSGVVDAELLRDLSADAYFSRPAPKSTGFEYFNLAWLESNRAIDRLPPEHVQATLCELTASTICESIRSFAPTAECVWLCGGGVHNKFLVGRIRSKLSGLAVEDTASLGVGPDWIEAAAFAWLAKRTLEGKPGNLPSVTGASKPAVLGFIHRPG
jgi:anhydro-N-acetylmuramic acid kinase